MSNFLRVSFESFFFLLGDVEDGVRTVVYNNGQIMLADKSGPRSKQLHQTMRCTNEGTRLRTNASDSSCCGREAPHRNSMFLQFQAKHVLDNNSTSLPINHFEGSEALGDITNGNTSVCACGRPSHVTKSANQIQKNGNWSNAQLIAAIAAYDEGMNMHEVAKKFHIAYTSFKNHLYGTHSSRERGAKGILSREEEDQLAKWLVQMAEWGLEMSPTKLRLKVSEITMNHATPFRNGIPNQSISWFKA